MSLSLKPSHTAVKAYYETLHQFGQLYIDHEGAVRSAFQALLAKCGQRAEPKLTLVPEYRIARAKKSSVIVDGALVDLYHLPHGYWEAKDERDDLKTEVQRKLDKGYPADNTIFQAPERAILYQNNARIFDENIARPEALVSVVNQFFDYKMPRIEEWQRAVDEFSERVPELSKSVEKLIKDERLKTPAFASAFADFYALCQQAINPNLSEDAVERMLVQHLLTERIFRKIFNNPDFSKRNVVAAEIEKVITELTRRAFNRDEFLKRLEPFYHAIETNADNATGFTEKQSFLNTVYERFFQGYSPKEADTHGIVYTPQPIVNFMVRSVEEILQKEFGRSLSDKGVHILDPFVGTGNFIVRIMQEIKTTALPYKYENELHCNEVMLLPYYIASMNIEHEYYERTNEYKPFPGICLVDTFELAEPEQSSLGFMTAENAERVNRQKRSQIFVIIGNPPYNAWQLDENDNNKNRKYKTISKRVAQTYSIKSRATLMTSLSDPYVKAFRWASDRIGEEGIVTFVSNNSFVDQVAFDGVRRCLAEEFSSIYILDLGGNVRKNPKLSGTTHNVFGIQVGVSINLLIKSPQKNASRAKIYYSKLEVDWRKEQKYKFLEEVDARENVPWEELRPDASSTWLNEHLSNDFDRLISLGAKETGSQQMFLLYSHGINTQRDNDVYNFDNSELTKSVQAFAETYNSEIDRWLRRGRPKDVDPFVDYRALKWSRNLKRHLRNVDRLETTHADVAKSAYRPFTTVSVYYADVAVDELGRMFNIFPPQSRCTNTCICVTAVGGENHS
jgi:predicted helicase